MDSDNGYVKGRWGQRGHVQYINRKVLRSRCLLMTLIGTRLTSREYPEQ